jgi:hypothetical protein
MNARGSSMMGAAKTSGRSVESFVSGQNGDGAEGGGFSV